MENRLQAIYEAASSLFINKGYARTQIKDIAQEIGLSAGMLYVYFKGKHEILQFILKCTIEPRFCERVRAYPIDAALFDGLTDEIAAVLAESRDRFGAPLARGAEGYPFSQMLSDAFDTIARYGTGCLVIEKNIGDVGTLGGAYLRYRKEFLTQLTAYVRLYLARGELRPLAHPELTAALIAETMAWWGMHVQNDAFEVRRDIPAAVAKEVCLDNLIHAYQAK